ncbi:MAG: hypothetical protein RIB45_17200 [Marivibrio sp.]|uniref:DUF4139 domain-containing protein n=1 Tax=Marivibrio sp. TaxID=2039719 RepID=UPI0032EEBE64
MSRRAALAVAAAMLAPLPALAQTASAPPPNAHVATLYRGGPAELRETRPVALDGPADVLIARDLPDGALGDSLAARFLPAAGGAAVVPDTLALQEAEAEPAALLARMVGREITWLTRNPATGAEEEITGLLRSAGRGWPVIERADGALEVLPPGRLLLRRPPADLALQRSVAVRFVAPVTTGTLQLRYETPSLGWDARYDGVLREDGAQLRLSADYLIRNDGAEDVLNAAVTLVAGDVPRAGGGGPGPQADAAMQARAMSAESAGPPQAQAVGDRQLYRLAAPIDLPGRSTVRRVLMGETAVPVTRRYVLEGRGEAWPGRVESGEELLRPHVRLTLANAADGPLARPLPAGTITVRAPDASTASADRPGAGLSTRLLAEARLPDLPVGAAATLDLGAAFDVTARRTMTAFEWRGPDEQRRNGPRPYEAEHEIILKNAKDAAVTVDVVERFNAPWTILQTSHPAQTADAGAARFAVEIPARAETALTYRVRVGGED